MTAWTRSLIVAISSLAGAAVGEAGTLRGRVVEAGHGAPLGGAVVQVVERRAGAFTNEAGAFALPDLVAGRLTLRVRVTGHLARDCVVVFAGADSTLPDLAVEPEPVPVSGVEVRADRDAPDGFAAQRAVELSGQRLRERLGGTIAETMAQEPGLAQRTLGPAPARPVLRGLGGYRLPVLEDGAGTGDLSATADDHAVTVDPLGVRALEVLRGPATFELGPGALAGVVNVRREYVPAQRPDGVHGEWNAQGESAARGAATGFSLAVPAGHWAFVGRGVLRGADDLRTPAAVLDNTEVRTTDFSAGLARLWSGGRFGAGVARYRSRYGIPGGFAGGHALGVDIDLERERREALVQQRLGGLRVASEFTFTRYYHRELEARDLPAVSFGLLTYEWRLALRPEAPAPNQEAAVGVSAEYRDYRSGFLNFTPPTIEKAGGAFAHRGWARGAWRLRAGLRADVRKVTPAGRDTNKAGVITERKFAGVGAGAYLERVLGAKLVTGLSVLHTVRAPSVEHLFAEGPHLASYAYEIGNAALAEEVGTGYEASLRWQDGATTVRAGTFMHDFGSYHFATDTGQLEVGPGAEGLLARYRFVGVPARLTGVDGAVEAHFGNGWIGEATLSLVRGWRRDDGTPLPAMPPAHGRVSCRRTIGEWGGHLEVDGAAAQRRTARFEEPTAGWCTLGAGLSWDRATAGRHVSVALAGQNLLDATYRDHLSRIKSIMPQAGRDVRLQVRLGF